MKPFSAFAVIGTVVLLSAPPAQAAPPQTKAQQSEKPKDTAAHPGYRIDQPGTITFTVGMVIKGKIEKPQVVIFLPKEKPFFRELNLHHSFADELDEPLPFTPLVE